MWVHQKKFLNKNQRKALLVHGMGSGKTRTAIEWAKMRDGVPLIVCPKGLKLNWRRECIKWGLELFVIISKEEFKKDIRHLDYKVLIIDEADHFFSAQFKSLLSKALRWYIKQYNPDLLMLSGTPYRSSAWNIYTACELLGIKMNYYQFKNDHFYEVRMGFRNVPMPKKDSAEKIRKLIHKIADVFNVEDGFDIPPQIDEVIYSGESNAQAKAHKENIEILPIVRFTRDHQIESGIGIDPKHDNKLELIRQYAIDTAKVAIVCRYRAQLDNYAKELIKAGHTVYQIHGDIVDRSGVLDQVEQAEKCVLLLQSATCEGYEAPSIALMIFASLDYSYRNYVQMKARILRMNRLHKNVYVHLLAGDTDKAVYQAMIDKVDFDVLKYLTR